MEVGLYRSKSNSHVFARFEKRKLVREVEKSKAAPEGVRLIERMGIHKETTFGDKQFFPLDEAGLERAKAEFPEAWDAFKSGAGPKGAEAALTREERFANATSRGELMTWDDADLKEFIRFRGGDVPRGNASHDTLVAAAAELL